MHDESKLALMDSDHRRLVRAASRLLGPAEAEDAVQDAYVRALESQALELNAAQAWLLTVVRHLAIDQLRRRQWMQQWLAGMSATDAEKASPSAEVDAGLAQEAARVLQLLASCLSPADGAALLLYLLFEATHAEIAKAGGRSEAGSRQQLRRALLRVRQAGDSPEPRPSAEPEPGEEAVLRLYVQALQLRDAGALWAMLRQPPIRALTGPSAGAVDAAATPPAATCCVMQAGGQLGLVLTLDGVSLCVLPLGLLPGHALETAPQ